LITKFTTGSETINSAQIEYLDKESTLTKENYREWKKLSAAASKAPLNKTLKANFEKSDTFMKTNNTRFMNSIGNGIHVSGYLRTRLYQKGYGTMSSDSNRKMMIKKEWNTIVNSHRQRKSSKYVGVRPIIFSPDPKKFSGLSRSEQTSFMKEFTARSMRNFQRKFLPTGDQIGYIYSVHTDKKHTHSHVYLLPYSKKGTYLSINAPKFFNTLQREKTGKIFASKKSNSIEESRALWLKSHNKSLFKSLLRSHLNLKKGISMSPLNKQKLSLNTPIAKRRKKNLEWEL
jgi:hypothetical protein